MASVSERDLVLNGKRRYKKDKPLPFELQTRPRGNGLREHGSMCLSRRWGMAVQWEQQGREPPTGGRTGRYVVRKLVGGKWLRFRCYDDIVVALACETWLKRKGFKSTTIDKW